VILSIFITTSIQLFIVGKKIDWNAFGEAKIMLILVSLMLALLLIVKFLKIKGFHSFLLKADLSKLKTVIKRGKSWV
jgi:hypothetical protein